MESYHTAVLEAPCRIAVRKRELKAPSATEVRVRLEGCGVCASSLPLWEGRPWFKYPRDAGAPGHEGWGIVDAVGDGVSRFSPGDRVAILSDHGFAEVDLADESRAIRLPAGLEGKDFPGEAFGCAMNILGRSHLCANHVVAIIGIGFLGAVLTKLAKRRGATVIAISRRSESLVVAGAMGADHLLPLTHTWRMVEEVREITGNDLCPRVIETGGVQATLDLATALSGEGGRLVIAGYHQDGLRGVNMQEWNWKALEIVNAHERDTGRCLRGMAAAAKAMADGQLEIDDFISHRFRLDQLGEAFEVVRERRGPVVKAVIHHEG
jgi:threonine dehydrogenase-like Zn-dependent dehydrogenase